MRTDLAVSIGTAASSAAIGLLVVPVYVRLLGVEAYGLVGFLALLQGALAVLDLGLVPTASRDVAEQRARGNLEAARSLIESLAWLYGIVGLLIGVAIAASSHAIAAYWLQPHSLSLTEVVTSVSLIGVILAFRWPAGIYTGALVGCRQLTLISLTNFASVLLASGMGIVIITFVSARIELLFLWQAIVSALQLIILRRASHKYIGRPSKKFDYFRPIARVWRFSAAMAGITIIALILTQLDKAIVSKFLSLKVFGIYSIAVVIGRSLYMLINPINQVIQPRFVALYTTNDHEKLKQYYHIWSSISATVFFPATLAVSMGAAPMLNLWLADKTIGAVAAPMVAFIAIGAGFHSVMSFPFALQMAAGDARTPLITNIILLIFYVPTLICLVFYLGALGAALASTLLFAAYLIFGTWMAHRRLFPSLARRWLVIDVGLPVCLTTVVGGMALLLLRHRLFSAIEGLGIAAATAAVAFALCCATLLIRFPTLLTMLSTDSGRRGITA